MHTKRLAQTTVRLGSHQETLIKETLSQLWVSHFLRKYIGALAH